MLTGWAMAHVVASITQLMAQFSIFCPTSENALSVATTLIGVITCSKLGANRGTAILEWLDWNVLALTVCYGVRKDMERLVFSNVHGYINITCCVPLMTWATEGCASLWKAKLLQARTQIGPCCCDFMTQIRLSQTDTVFRSLYQWQNTTGYGKIDVNIKYIILVFPYPLTLHISWAN